MPFGQYELQFFTATILEWKKLLVQDKYKDIIIDSLTFIAIENRAKIYAFVIMNNHIHILWHIIHPHKRQDVQRDFLKYTAQKIQADLKKHHTKVLEIFRVNAADRKYQFWEPNPLSVVIWSDKVLLQKLQYIHEKPVKSGLCNRPENYKYSSANFYKNNDTTYSFLNHYFDS